MNDMGKEKDEFYMHRALDLAEHALGQTNPNPLVGAVIEKDGIILGEGYHRKAGTPHAEIHALQAAGENAHGATLYVTLEPCSHFGRTPPCADAVIRAGIARAVIATIDPNPLVAGKGIEKLRQAGIEVRDGVLRDRACRLNDVFFKYIRTSIPLVALKTAMSLDGKIATVSGDSRWISGEESRLYVHQLRNVYDAIMVGIGTVLKDDPLLNTRLPFTDTRDPVRVIIDTWLDLPPDSNVARTSREQRTLVFCSEKAGIDRREELENLGVEIMPIVNDSELIPLEIVLAILGEMGICSLMVEGGGEINGYLMQKHLVDKVYWFIAPKIIGGRQAPSPVGGTGINLMKEAQELKSVEMSKLGNDCLLIGYLKEWCD